MGARKRILVVDDEEQVLFVWHSALQKRADEYEVVTAKSGDEALDKVKRAPFDLIVTDLRMPGMDGVELTEAIRTLRPDAPVIWITAYSSQETSAEARRLGVYRCLDKPLEVDEIRQVVQEALEATEPRTRTES